jgi:hypothetical protein
MMRRTLVSAVLLSLGACATSISLNDNWSTWSWFGTEPSSERATLTIECAPDATRVRTHLRADGAAGELTLRLVDPRGVERHRQVVHVGRCEVEQTWPVQAGVWTLHVEPNDFSGSYSLELSARDEPIPVRVELAGDPPR